MQLLTHLGRKNTKPQNLAWPLPFNLQFKLYLITMQLIKSIRANSFLKTFMLLNVLVLSSLVYSQEDKTSNLKFNFICDHSQTTIVADQSIMIYIMSVDQELLVKGLTYCSRKELKLPKGTYSVIIESSKYCTHIIDKYVVADAEQKIEVDLLKESDPACKNEQIQSI